MMNPDQPVNKPDEPIPMPSGSSDVPDLPVEPTTESLGRTGQGKPLND